MGQLLDTVRALQLDEPQTWVADLGPPTAVPDVLSQELASRNSVDLVAPTTPDPEQAFQQWYGTWAARYGQDPNPDTQPYNFRAAFQAGVQPPNLERGEQWPATFATAPPEPTLQPDPGAREKPPVIPGPGSVIGSALGLVQAPYAAGAGALLDRPGDLAHAGRAAWEAVQRVPATVYQPFGAQDLPTLGGEAQKRGVPLTGGQTLVLDVLGDPTNIVGGNPVTDALALGKGLAFGAPKLAALGFMTASDVLLRSEKAIALANAIEGKYPRFAAALKAYSVPSLRQAVGSTAATADDFLKARSQSTRIGFLSPLTAEELAEQKLYLSQDRTVGGALTKDGDVGNLFNNGGPKGGAQPVILQMLEDGGRTLDAFDDFLPKYYADYGFQETGRMKFNPDFAPPGWNYARDDNPDVVFMARTAEAAEAAGNVRTIRERLTDESQRLAHQPTTRYFDDYDAAKRDALARADADRTRATAALRADVRGGVGQSAGGDSAARGASARGSLVTKGGDLPYAPVTWSDRLRALVSTRVPTAKGRTAIDQALFTDLATLKASKTQFANVAERLRASPMLTAAEQALPADQLIEAFVERAKQNLLKLWDDTPDYIRVYSRQWYEGAHARMLEDAKALGITPEQSSALIAVLSPQNDWFVNAELARRVGYTWKELSETNAVFTQDVFDKYKALLKNTNKEKLKTLADADREAIEAALKSHGERQALEGELRGLSTDERAALDRQLGVLTDAQRAELEAQLPTELDPKKRASMEKKLERWTPEERQELDTLLEEADLDEQAEWVGKTFNELPIEAKVRMIRAFSEGTHPKLSYNMILPDGSIGPVVRNAPDVTPKALAKGQYGLQEPTAFKWSVSYDMLKSAVSVLENGDLANISKELGNEHKVRSFFNNINDPWDARSVTIDTHAVAAAHLMPYSEKAPYVRYALGGFSDNALGLSGSNPVYAEAYNRAARERGVLPREMQSVTWETSRALFSPANKRNPAFVKEIRELWEQYNTGRMTLEEVHESIKTAAGGISEPTWAASIATRR